VDRQSVNVDHGGFLASRVRARNGERASFLHDAQLHAPASRMHWHCLLASRRDKINRALGAFFNQELHLPHRFAAFSDLGFAALALLNNERVSA